jgi:hypothetical protein
VLKVFFFMQSSNSTVLSATSGAHAAFSRTAMADAAATVMNLDIPLTPVSVLAPVPVSVLAARVASYAGLTRLHRSG